jgi:signal transduction histidine kinase
VLLNLLDNAVKYGPLGGQVVVRTSREGRRAVLTVEDQGPGIPPDEREGVFHPYVRGEDHLEGGTGGTGIGLAIVRDLVARAGGSTRAEAAPGGGARLRVDVPLVSMVSMGSMESAPGSATAGEGA